MSLMPPPIEMDVEYQSIFRSELAWAGVSEMPASHQIDRHKHDFWEFICISRGEGAVEVGRERFDARRGDMFAYPPGVEHSESASPDGPLVMKVLSIINTSDMNFMRFWPLGEAAFTRIPGGWLAESFERILDRILDEFSRMETGYMIRVNALSFEFQSYLVQYSEQHGARASADAPHRYVNRSRQYIQSHYHQNITLTDIAADSFVSTYYLSHLFKEYTGFSPMSYLTALRMRKAQEMLKDTEHTISEISQRVGYDDLQHFSNAFKKYTGCSPRAYRLSSRGEVET